MRRWLPWVIVVVVVAIAIPLAWKLSARWSAGDGNDPVPVAGADLSGSGPGNLLSAMTMPGFAASREGKLVRGCRVIYRSTSGDTGQATQVSGSVFTPEGTAPTGGWPVIAFGHGTTGIDEPCAPSLSYSLLGVSTVVVGYANLGYAVALPDYQGLGAPGVHPYTDARTAGLEHDRLRARAAARVRRRVHPVGRGGRISGRRPPRGLPTSGPPPTVRNSTWWAPWPTCPPRTSPARRRGAREHDEQRSVAGVPVHRGIAGAPAPRAEPRRLPSWRRGEVLGPVVRLFGPAGLRS